MTIALVLLDFKLPNTYRESLEKRLAPMRVVYAKDETALDADTMADTEVIFGLPDPHTLARYPALKWLQLPTAGNDQYAGAFTGHSAATVTNASGAYDAPVAEYMLAGVLTLSKRLHQYRDAQRTGAWKPLGRVKRIAGSVVLVVGLGAIGGEFARKMKALGAYVIGVRRTEAAKPDYADEVVLTSQLDEVLPKADVVAMIVPNTDATKGLFNRERLAKIKRGAILVNAGRGNVIDTEALCDALSSGDIGGAVLDVTEPEPLPPEHRLWTMENALVTPHVAGGLHMDGTLEAILDICLDNAARYKKGAELRNIVDFSIGY
jgi:phosphoglycerate dehydrogenase-like enzyme